MNEHKKWEYYTLFSSMVIKDVHSTLNALGMDGWELVSSYICQDNDTCFRFKRPLLDAIDGMWVISIDFDDRQTNYLTELDTGEIRLTSRLHEAKLHTEEDARNTARLFNEQGHVGVTYGVLNTK